MSSDKPTLIEALKADYKARRRKITLLGIDVWVSPLTVEDENLLAEREPRPGASRYAEMAMMKCTDESGSPIFTRNDKDVLISGAASDQVARLVNAITGPSVEAQAKN